MPKKSTPVRQVPVAPDEEMVSVPASALSDDPNHPTRWMHRRRMAYISLFSMITLMGYTLTPWMPLDRLEKLSDVIDWFFFAMASIVGAYMGFATWSGRTSRHG